MDLTLEDLNNKVSTKMIQYLQQESIKPIHPSDEPQDRMMIYAERLAAEKELFRIYRHAIYLLDILVENGD